MFNFSWKSITKEDIQAVQHKAILKNSKIPAITFNQEGPLPQFTDPNTSFIYSPKQGEKYLSAGRNFLLDAIDNINKNQLQIFIDQHHLKISATELENAIRHLQFHIREDGSEINPEEPLFAISGNPLAIAVIKTMALPVVSKMTAIATYAKKLVDISKKFPEIGPVGFAYFGLRRGDTYDRSNDEAAAIGGFGLVANTNAFITQEDKKTIREEFRPKKELKLTGTTAHAYVCYLTTILMKAESHDLVKALFNELFKDKASAILNQYNELKADIQANKKPACGIYDFFSFCAYTRSVELIESDLNVTNKSRPIVDLVDTTETIDGTKAAIKAAKIMDRPFTGVRLDTNPLKYIEQVANLYLEAGLPIGTRIYCTDGIDDETLEKILTTYNTWLEKNQDKIQEKYGKANPFPLVFGIGSSVANQAPVELNEEINLEAKNLQHLPTISLSDFPKPENPRKPNDVYNHLNTLPCDAYSCIQWALIEKLNVVLKSNPELEKLAPKESVATLHFRHRPNTPNYLITAGLDAITQVLNNHEFNDDMIARMKACNPGFPESFYEQLKKTRKLKVEITTRKDGDIATPYEPILNIKGDPGHVLFVESYILTTFGSMSATATQAREIIDALGFTKEELANPDNLAKACKFYNIKSENIDQLNKNEQIEFLIQNFNPTFSYCGLTAQGNPTSQRAYAVKLGGFKETTQDQGFMPTTQFDADTVVIDLDKINLNQLADKIITLNLNGKTLFIRGDMPAEIMPILREQLIKAEVNLKQVKFLTRDPIASAENLKGTVFKQGANVFPDGSVVHVSKAGGATGGEPDVKTSVPGVLPQVVLLKDKSGKPVGTVIVDLSLFKEDKRDINSVLAAILKNNVVLYYDHGKSKKVIASDSIDLSTSQNKFKAEFLLKAPLNLQDSSAQISTPEELKSNLVAAAQNAQVHLGKEDRQHLPVYMEHEMYLTVSACLDTSSKLSQIQERKFNIFSPGSVFCG